MSSGMLRKQLQKSFCVLQQVSEIFKTTLAECAPHFRGLINLCEQYTSCCSVRNDMLPFIAKMPDVKERLLFKLGVEIDAKIETIRSKIYLLKNGQERFKRQLDFTMKTYNKYTSDLDIETMTCQTAVSPSMAEMLEWLTVAEKVLYVQYHMKEHLLDKLVSMDTSEHENLLAKWCKGDVEMFEMIQDYLCCVKFLLEEDI